MTTEIKEIWENGRIERDCLKDYVIENIPNNSISIMRFLMGLIGGEHYEYSEYGSCYLASENGTKFRIANHVSKQNRTWNIEILINEDEIEKTAEAFVQELFDGMGNFHF